MAQERTSSGPTNMAGECPLQQESKIDLPQDKFGQKSEYYTKNLKAHAHPLTAPVAAQG